MHPAAIAIRRHVQYNWPRTNERKMQLEITEGKQNGRFDSIDFSQLMDLRVDYAFKLVFGTGDTLFLASLLNAVFADKNTGRVIKSLAILNPHLEKRSENDKLSILDVKAQLDDGTTVLVEMHLYDLYDLKYKTIRSWARAYGEGLSGGEGYRTQPPVVCVAFANGQVGKSREKRVHKCCKIMDMDEKTVFSDALELHYIDMAAFVKSINKTGTTCMGGKLGTALARWLAVIAEKDIEDKSIIRSACEEQEEIGMAVSALARLSKDKLARLEYLQRQDEIALYNMRINEYRQALDDETALHSIRINEFKQALEQEKKKAEQEKKKAEQEKKKAEQEKFRAESAEEEILNLRKKLAAMEANKKP